MKRYTIISPMVEHPSRYGPVEDPNGNWVRYEDMPQWVSVEERLPEKHRTVLVLRVHPYDPSARNIETSINYGDGLQANITHWMPLPEPPE